MPYPQSLPLCVPQGTISVVIALSIAPVLSGVTGHTLSPPLLQGKQKVLSHVSIASVILTLETVPSLFSEETQCPNHFLSYVFCWKLAGCEIGSGAYLTSQLWPTSPPVTLLPPFPPRPVISPSTPWKSQATHSSAHPSLLGGCNPEHPLAASPVGCGPHRVSFLPDSLSVPPLHPEFQWVYLSPSYCTCSGNLDTYVTGKNTFT